MKDKFIRGMISGFAGSVAKDFLGLILVYIIKLTPLSFWDYAGMIVFLRRPKGVMEYLFSMLIQLSFGMFLGSVYSYLSPLLNSKHYIIKGAVYGTVVWFGISTAILVFKLNIEGHSTLNTAIANLLTALVYGAVLGVSDNYLKHNEIS